MPHQPFHEYYEDLKQQIHKKLVDKLDPSKVSQLTSPTLRLEIRLVIERLVDGANPLLSLMEREKLILDVLHMALGPAPEDSPFWDCPRGS